MRHRAVLAGLLAAVTVLGLPVAASASAGTDREPGFGITRVRSDGERLLDDRGRQVLLRGFHHLALRSNRESPLDPHAPFDELFDVVDAEVEDFALIASMGLNSVRLSATWEFVQPDAPPAAFNEAYLELLDEAIDNAEEAGITVMLNFAQFGFSRYVGGNAGAPAWAIPDDCLLLPPGGPGPPQKNPQVNCAFNAFWENQGGIQDEYVRMWEHVAARYAGHPNVTLADMFNEPINGFVPPVTWERDHLLPFYRRLAAAIRGVDPDRAVGFQPYIGHSFGAPPLWIEPIGIENSVYTPHNYTAAFATQQVTPQPLPNQSAITRQDVHMTADEAAQFGAPLVNGETGWVRCEGSNSFDNPVSGDCDAAGMLQFADDLTAAMDEVLGGWHWAAYSTDPGDATRSVRPDGELDVELAAALSRPWPHATAGRIVSVAFDPTTLAYEQHTTDTFDDVSELALPIARRYVDGACVAVDGTVVAVVAADGTLTEAEPGVRFVSSRQLLVLPGVGDVLTVTAGTDGCGVGVATAVTGQVGPTVGAVLDGRSVGGGQRDLAATGGGSWASVAVALVALALVTRRRGRSGHDGVS